ncbi:hypothetical protein GS538_09090 [Rhodococcus hoagii]|nr:hypothetical protein [Prescottella equi]
MTNHAFDSTELLVAAHEAWAQAPVSTKNVRAAVAKNPAFSWVVGELEYGVGGVARVAPSHAMVPSRTAAVSAVARAMTLNALIGRGLAR